MSKRYNIRWQESDNEALRKAVKNFNAKIKRLEKKNPQLKNVLPEKTSVAQMRELIETRQDLKRELNALKRFSKRGSETIVNVPDNDYNLKTTKWQKEEMTRRIGIINRKRKARLKEVQETPLQSRGKDLGYTKGQLGMGKQEEVSLTPMRAFTPKMTQYDLKHKFKNIMKESQNAYWHKRDLQLKSNYIKSLEENFNPNDVKDIIKRIDRMDFKEFKKVFDSEGGNFEWSYPPDQEAYEEYLTALKSIWLPNYDGGRSSLTKQQIDSELKGRVLKTNRLRKKGLDSDYKPIKLK